MNRIEFWFEFASTYSFWLPRKLIFRPTVLGVLFSPLTYMVLSQNFSKSFQKKLLRKA